MTETLYTVNEKIVQLVTKVMTPASTRNTLKQGSWLLWPTVHSTSCVPPFSKILNGQRVNSDFVKIFVLFKLQLWWTLLKKYSRNGILFTLDLNQWECLRFSENSPNFCQYNTTEKIRRFFTESRRLSLIQIQSCKIPRGSDWGRFGCPWIQLVYAAIFLNMKCERTNRRPRPLKSQLWPGNSKFRISYLSPMTCGDLNIFFSVSWCTANLEDGVYHLSAPNREWTEA